MVAESNEREPVEYVRESDALEHTANIARDIASVLEPGDIVRLDGELGVGKTTLAREICISMGVQPGRVSSPTYVIMNLYERGEHQAPIAHIDCYRLGDESELHALGLDTLEPKGDGKDPIMLVEWAQKIEGTLDIERVCFIRLEHTGVTSRRIEITAPGSWRDRAKIGVLKPRGWTRCPKTRDMVHPETTTWPFSNDRARLNDLHGWMSEDYSVSRDIKTDDEV